MIFRAALQQRAFEYNRQIILRIIEEHLDPLCGQFPAFDKAIDDFTANIKAATLDKPVDDEAGK